MSGTGYLRMGHVQVREPNETFVDSVGGYFKRSGDVLVVDGREHRVVAINTHDPRTQRPVLVTYKRRRKIP